MKTDIKIINGDKYYHDNNVAGLMILSFVVGSFFGFISCAIVIGKYMETI